MALPAGMKRPEPVQEIEVFRSNLPALSIWQGCNKPIEIGMAGAIPVGVETVEIESVCRVCDTKLTPVLLTRIRALDAAYRDAVVDDLNKRANTQ